VLETATSLSVNAVGDIVGPGWLGRSAPARVLLMHLSVAFIVRVRVPTGLAGVALENVSEAFGAGVEAPWPGSAPPS
jgi:hypothetical protein